MKVRTIAIHLLFWLSTGWLITSGFSIEQQEIEIINGEETLLTIRNPMLIRNLVACIIISAVMAYTNLWSLKDLQHGRSSQIVGMRSLGIYAIGLLVLIILNKLVHYSGAIQLPMSLLVGISLFYFTLSLAYGLVEAWAVAENRKRELEVEKQRAEISLLRNQLQPHFLFNALNNLLSMVDQRSSPRLAQSFEKLSQLLRYVIDETRDGQVTVKQEIDFCKNYIGLQLLRFEAEEVKVDFNVLGTHYKQIVEPGLFISFIENAFKYGTEPECSTGIHITFDLQSPDEVTFRIRNKVMRNGGGRNGGTGLRSVRERLQLVYPEKHDLVIEKGEDFAIQLNIQTR